MKICACPLCACRVGRVPHNDAGTVAGCACSLFRGRSAWQRDRIWSCQVYGAVPGRFGLQRPEWPLH
eukprot:3686606-Prymnesium_polylepis.1